MTIQRYILTAVVLIITPCLFLNCSSPRSTSSASAPPGASAQETAEFTWEDRAESPDEERERELRLLQTTNKNKFPGHKHQQNQQPN